MEKNLQRQKATETQCNDAASGKATETQQQKATETQSSDTATGQAIETQQPSTYVIRKIKARARKSIYRKVTDAEAKRFAVSDDANLSTRQATSVATSEKAIDLTTAEAKNVYVQEGLNVIKKSLTMFSPKSGPILERLGVFMEEMPSSVPNRPTQSEMVLQEIGEEMNKRKRDDFGDDYDFGNEFEKCLAETLARDGGTALGACTGLEPVDHEKILNQENKDSQGDKNFVSAKQVAEPKVAPWLDTNDFTVCEEIEMPWGDELQQSHSKKERSSDGNVNLVLPQKTGVEGVGCGGAKKSKKKVMVPHGFFPANISFEERRAKFPQYSNKMISGEQATGDGMKVSDQLEGYIHKGNYTQILTMGACLYSQQRILQ